MHIIRPLFGIWLTAFLLGCLQLDWQEVAFLIVVLAGSFYKEADITFRHLRLTFLGLLPDKSKYEYKLVVAFAWVLPFMLALGGFMLGWAIFWLNWSVLLIALFLNLYSLIVFLFSHKFVI